MNCKSARTGIKESKQPSQRQVYRCEGRGIVAYQELKAWEFPSKLCNFVREENAQGDLLQKQMAETCSKLLLSFTLAWRRQKAEAKCNNEACPHTAKFRYGLRIQQQECRLCLYADRSRVCRIVSGSIFYRKSRSCFSIRVGMTGATTVHTQHCRWEWRKWHAVCSPAR